MSLTEGATGPMEEVMETIWSSAGSLLPGTLEEIALLLVVNKVQARLDGLGYLYVDCDGHSPEWLEERGCRPVTTMQPKY